MKKRIFVVSIIAIMIIACIYLSNYITLQNKLNNVITNDYRNADVNISVHYQYYILPKKIVFDIKKIGVDKSPIDIYRLLFQFAEITKNNQYNQVILSYKGKNKYYLNGSYWKKIGDEYSWQNPIYTLRTLPENVYKLDGTKAYNNWTGGMLGVLSQQMDDLNNLSAEWFIEFE